MRVISGTARGRRLFSPEDRSVRPTSDRVKEALFSIITSLVSSLSDVSVLDLCAGSGGLGIEALSRGAKSAVFVDAQRSSTALIEKNLAATGLADKGKVLVGDATAILPRLAARKELFDLVFADPPYGKGLAEKILVQVAALSLLKEDALLIIETATTEELPPLYGKIRQLDRRTYGDTAITFYTTST